MLAAWLWLKQKQQFCPIHEYSNFIIILFRVKVQNIHVFIKDIQTEKLFSWTGRITSGPFY